jgi:hypothetical protein
VTSAFWNELERTKGEGPINDFTVIRSRLVRGLCVLSVLERMAVKNELSRGELSRGGCTCDIAEAGVLA